MGIQKQFGIQLDPTPKPHDTQTLFNYPSTAKANHKYKSIIHSLHKISKTLTFNLGETKGVLKLFDRCKHLDGCFMNFHLINLLEFRFECLFDLTELGLTAL